MAKFSSDKNFYVHSTIWLTINTYPPASHKDSIHNFQADRSWYLELNQDTLPHHILKIQSEASSRLQLTKSVHTGAYQPIINWAIFTYYNTELS